MMNFRKTIALLAVTSLVFSVSACSSSASTDSKDTGNITEQTEAVMNSGDDSENAELPLKAVRAALLRISRTGTAAPAVHPAELPAEAVRI